MNAIMPILAKIVLLGVLAVYFALMGLVAYAVFWFARQLVHDHFSVRQAWHDATSRLFGVHR